MQKATERSAILFWFAVLQSASFWKKYIGRKMIAAVRTNLPISRSILHSPSLIFFQMPDTVSWKYSYLPDYKSYFLKISPVNSTAFSVKFSQRITNEHLLNRCPFVISFFTFIWLLLSIFSVFPDKIPCDFCQSNGKEKYT